MLAMNVSFDGNRAASSFKAEVSSNPIIGGLNDKDGAYRYYHSPMWRSLPVSTEAKSTIRESMEYGWWKSGFR
jgi:hypothetical protein